MNLNKRNTVRQNRPKRELIVLKQLVCKCPICTMFKARWCNTYRGDGKKGSRGIKRASAMIRYSPENGTQKRQQTLKGTSKLDFAPFVKTGGKGSKTQDTQYLTGGSSARRFPLSESQGQSFFSKHSTIFTEEYTLR